MPSDLTEHRLDVDGQVAVGTAEAAHDAEAQTLRAFLQGDTAGAGSPEERGRGLAPSQRQRKCVCVCVSDSLWICCVYECL